MALQKIGTTRANHTSRCAYLRILIHDLPETLPTPPNTSYAIHLDPDWVEDVGHVGALNRALEATVGQRAKGPIVFRERGVGLCGVVDTIENILDNHCGNTGDVILYKWIDDLMESAMKACGRSEETSLAVCFSWHSRLQCSPRLLLVETEWHQCGCY